MKHGTRPSAPLVHTIRDNCTDTPPTIGKLKPTETAQPNPAHTKWAKRRQAKALDVKVSSGLFTYVRGQASQGGPHEGHFREWAKRYSASLFCCHTIHHNEGHVESGHYCGAKWCRVCSRIRAAANFQKYGRQLAELAELHFVTLTSGPRVAGHELGETIHGMVKAWRHVYRTMKDWGYPLAGFRKLEVTYDPGTNTYHPHFHILIGGIAPALGLQRLWLKHYGNQVSQAGQHCQVVLDHNRERAVIELMKYTNKTADHKALMDAEALHTINVATFGRQMFTPFGIKAAKPQQAATPEPDKVDWLPKRAILFVWDDAAGNWVDSTDSALSFVRYDPGILDAIGLAANIAPHGP